MHHNLDVLNRKMLKRILKLHIVILFCYLSKQVKHFNKGRM